MIASVWSMVCDHLPGAMTVFDLDGFPGGFLVEDSVSSAAFKDFVHGCWLAFYTHFGSLDKDLCPVGILTVSADMCHPEDGSVCWFSWNSIILEVFEEEILSYIMLRTVILADSVDGEVGWQYISYLCHFFTRIFYTLL